MQKNSITNKITPCCGLPFSVVYWWVSNLTLNSESDRQFILSKISQNGILSIDGWKVLINSGTLEADASLTKSEFLAWFDCGRQPSCEQLKLIIEGYRIGNWDANDDLPENIEELIKSEILKNLAIATGGWTPTVAFETYNGKRIVKITGYVGGVGTLPDALAANVGKYIGEGEYTTDKNSAIDFGGKNGETITLPKNLLSTAPQFLTTAERAQVLENLGIADEKISLNVIAAANGSKVISDALNLQIASLQKNERWFSDSENKYWSVSPIYKDFFIDDFHVAFFATPDYFETKDIVNFLKKYLNNPHSTGLFADSLNQNGQVADYFSGADLRHNYPSPRSACLIPVYYEFICNREKNMNYFAEVAMKIKNGLLSIPINPITGLMHVTKGNEYVPWCFEEIARHTGDVAYGSINMWRGLMATYRMFNAIGDEANANQMKAMADKIKANMAHVDSPLWNKENGMFVSATGQNATNLSINASAFAVSIGFIDGEMAESVSNYIVSNYDDLAEFGFMVETVRIDAEYPRPTKNTWTYMGWLEADGSYGHTSLYPPGQYQNGGLWSICNKYILDVIALTDKQLAVQYATDILVAPCPTAERLDYRIDEGMTAPAISWNGNGDLISGISETLQWMLENRELFESDNGRVTEILSSDGRGGVKTGGIVSANTLEIIDDGNYDGNFIKRVSGIRKIDDYYDKNDYSFVTQIKEGNEFSGNQKTNPKGGRNLFGGEVTIGQSDFDDAKQFNTLLVTDVNKKIATGVQNVEGFATLRINLANPIVTFNVFYLDTDTTGVQSMRNGESDALALQPFGGGVSIGKTTKAMQTLDVNGGGLFSSNLSVGVTDVKNNIFYVKDVSNSKAGNIHEVEDNAMSVLEFGNAGVKINYVYLNSELAGIQSTKNNTALDLVLQPFGGAVSIGKNTNPLAELDVAGSGHFHGNVSIGTGDMAKSNPLVVRDNQNLIVSNISNFEEKSTQVINFANPNVALCFGYLNTDFPALQSVNTGVAKTLAVQPFGGGVAIGKTTEAKATLDVNGTLIIGSINEYENNAEAIVAGLPTGHIYRTGDTLKIVH